MTQAEGKLKVGQEVWVRGRVNGFDADGQTLVDISRGEDLASPVFLADVLPAAPDTSGQLREAAQWVIEWEQDYRTRNNLGKNPPMVFIHLAKALAGSRGTSAGAQTNTAILERFGLTAYDFQNLLEQLAQASDAAPRYIGNQGGMRKGDEG